MKAVKIMWSGLSKPVGKKALWILANQSKLAKKAQAEDSKYEGKRHNARIVSGVSHFDYRDPNLIPFWEMEWDDEELVAEVQDLTWYRYSDICDPLKDRPREFDVLVDLSDDLEAFDEVLGRAVRAEKPLVISGSDLPSRQMAALYTATNRIPIFYDKVIHFGFKKFVDEAVEFAKEQNSKLYLFENFYEGKKLPSKESKLIQKKILEVTGKEVEVSSSATLSKGSWSHDWWMESETNTGDHPSCNIFGVDDLADNVLAIAAIMAKQPVKAGEFYNLEKLWGQLPV